MWKSAASVPRRSLPTGGWEHSQVTIERDGRISATTGASPHGQGNETTFAQMLADQFGVPIEHVTILHGDTGVVKQGIGTFGSRSQAVGGTALHMAGGKVKTKMAKFAAALLEAHEDDLVFENGTIFVKGAPASASRLPRSPAFAYVPVPLPTGFEPGLSEEAFFEPANNTYPFGCHISMLEIDRDTGEPTLLKLVAVDDAGHLINPLIVEGQIHGGLAQGIGQAMIEEAVYNADGQLVTGSFMDYAMPRATDFPRFELDATVTPTPVNPLGAKGVGEAGTLGSTPCIVSAAVDALSGFGVKHIDMMLRPGEAVADHSGRPGVIPTAFDYQRADVARRCAGEAQAAGGGGKLLAGGHSLRAADEAAAERAHASDRHRAHPGAVAASARRTAGSRSARARCITRSRRRRCCGEKCPVVAEAAAAIGDPQVRNRGTLGGSLAHADPSADYPAAMLALDAEIHVKGPNGRRVGEGAGLLPGPLHGGPGAGRDHRRRAVRAGRSRGLRQAPPARVALRHRRRRGGARCERRHDPSRPASA